VETLLASSEVTTARPGEWTSHAASCARAREDHHGAEPGHEPPPSCVGDLARRPCGERLGKRRLITDRVAFKMEASLFGRRSSGTPTSITNGCCARLGNVMVRMALSGRGIHRKLPSSLRTALRSSSHASVRPQRAIPVQPAAAISDLVRPTRGQPASVVRASLLLRPAKGQASR